MSVSQSVCLSTCLPVCLPLKDITQTVLKKATANESEKKDYYYSIRHHFVCVWKRGGGMGGGAEEGIKWLVNSWWYRNWAGCTEKNQWYWETRTIAECCGPWKHHTSREKSITLGRTTELVSHERRRKKKKKINENSCRQFFMNKPIQTQLWKYFRPCLSHWSFTGSQIKPHKILMHWIIKRLTKNTCLTDDYYGWNIWQRLFCIFYASWNYLINI